MLKLYNNHDQRRNYAATRRKTTDLSIEVRIFICLDPEHIGGLNFCLGLLRSLDWGNNQMHVIKHILVPSTDPLLQ